MSVTLGLTSIVSRIGSTLETAPGFVVRATASASGETYSDFRIIFYETPGYDPAKPAQMKLLTSGTSERIQQEDTTAVNGGISLGSNKQLYCVLAATGSVSGPVVTSETSVIICAKQPEVAILKTQSSIRVTITPDYGSGAMPIADISYNFNTTSLIHLAYNWTGSPATFTLEFNNLSPDTTYSLFLSNQSGSTPYLNPGFVQETIDIKTAKYTEAKMYGSVLDVTEEVERLYGPVNGLSKRIIKLYGSENGYSKVIFNKGDWGELKYYDYSITPASYSVQNATYTTFDYETLIDEIILDNSGDNIVWPVTLVISRYGYIDARDSDHNYIYCPYYDLNTLNQELGSDLDYIDPSTDITISLTAESINIDTSHVNTIDFIYEAQYTRYKYAMGGYVLDDGTVIRKEAIKSFRFGDDARMIPDDFLRESAVETVTNLHQKITGCGEHFLYNCVSFNSPMDFSHFATCPGYLLGNCSSFNSAITLNPAWTEIGRNFLFGCATFNQSVTIPSSVTTVEQSFMSNCTAFNQSIDLSNITSVGWYFMSGCTSFNQSISLNSSLQTIPRYFLDDCAAFNQPITLPSSLRIIEMDFLSGCTAFNQPITIPASVSTISPYFLYQCSSFNQDITFAGNPTEIGNYFLYECSSFDRALTIPSTVTKIGTSFMYGCSSFGDHPIDISHCTEIGMRFMYNCTAWETSSNIVINQDCTAVGTYFMYNCKKFKGNVEVNAAATVFSTGNYTLSTNDASAYIYTNGVTITGTNASAFKTRFPNRTSSPYRKLL